MSSPSFADTVDLTLRPSLRGLQVLFVLHALPVAALPFTMASGAPLMLLLAAFALSWVWLRRNPALGFGPRALVRLVWHADGHWTVYNREGRQADAELLASSYRQPALMVLNFKLANATRRTRVLIGDEADPESMRRLRARLSAE